MRFTRAWLTSPAPQSWLRNRSYSRAGDGGGGAGGAVLQELFEDAALFGLAAGVLTILERNDLIGAA